MMNDELKSDFTHHSSLIAHRFPRLYPLTDCALTKLSHAEQTKRLIAGGARLIQLRDKSATPSEFYEAACEAVAIARAGGAKIIINDRADIALACRADGVHLGQDDLPVEAARALLGREAIIGISTHNVAQVRAALNAPVSYIAVGPVFMTASKDKPEPVVGLEGLALVRTLIPPHIPLVAIGGITAENASRVLAAGADCVACIGAVLSVADEIAEHTRRFLAHIS